MEKNRLTGKTLILFLLYSPTKEDGFNTPVSGRTRLMKMGFLFQKEILDEFSKEAPFEETKLPEYFAWKYGPFSTEFLNDLEFLVNQEYVQSQMSSGTPIAEELAEYEYWIEGSGRTR